ncbi:hypothetical protein NN561_009648 [Cricetulus griseus]
MGGMRSGQVTGLACSHGQDRPGVAAYLAANANALCALVANTPGPHGFAASLPAPLGTSSFFDLPQSLENQDFNLRLWCVTLTLEPPARASGLGAAGGVGLAFRLPEGRTERGAEPAVIGHGNGGPVGAESLGQAGFTSLPAGTGSPAGWSSAVLAAVAVAVAEFLQPLCELCLTCICTTSATPRRQRLGALPLALVPPMSDSDSRTEKRKVNTPRFAIPGAQAGDRWKTGAAAAECLHLSLASHVRVEALVGPAWRAAAASGRNESGRGPCLAGRFWDRVVGTEAAGTSP